MATQQQGPTVRIGDKEFTADMVKYTADTMPVSSWHPTSDPTWRATDTRGHEHYYDSGYPTLNFVVDRQHWCEGNEGWMSHDPHWAVDESHYECLQCRETTRPGLRPPGWIEHVVTNREITVTITGDVPFSEHGGAMDDVSGTFLPIRQDRRFEGFTTTEFAFVPA